MWSFTEYLECIKVFIKQQIIKVLQPTPLYKVVKYRLISTSGITLSSQSSTLRPVGSPVPLDLVCWWLTFDVWSPVWPPGFQVIILFLYFFPFLRSMTNQKKWLLPPFSLIRDFGKQNTRRNVSKISVSLTRYWQIESKFTNHMWLSDLLDIMLTAVIGGFWFDMSITCKTDGNFGNFSAGVLFSKVAYQWKRW